MSPVQKMVHLAARASPDDEAAWRSKMLNAYRREFETTLEQEAAAWGCPGRRAGFTDPAVVDFYQAAAARSAASITNTYNYYLALEIFSIAEATPTANRHVYAHRLYYAPDAWARRYRREKVPEIAITETYDAIGAAKDRFYRRNAWLNALVVQVEVRPYDTACEVCALVVAGNPYPSREALAGDAGLPPYHIKCPHYEAVTGSRQLTGEECAELWLG
jgi:hypothetical protein